jgi:hypothetical protein
MVPARRGLFGLVAVWLAIVGIFVNDRADAASRYVQPFYINITTFTSNSTLAGQGDPTQIILAATHAWQSYAGLSLDFAYAGTTLEAGCMAGFVDPHVWMSSVCPPWDPTCASTFAYFQWCISGFSVDVLGPPGRPWSLSPTTAGALDLQQVVSHEFGHFLFSTHVDPSDGSLCVMSSLGTSTPNRYFCDDEMATMQGGGWCYSGTPQIATTTSTQASGWASPRSLSNSIGVGLGIIARGAVNPSFFRDSYFRTTSMCETEPVSRDVLCDYQLDGSASDCSTDYVSLPGNSGAARRRVTVAYDSLRKTWWRFQPLDDPNGAGRNLVAVHSSPDRASWTSLGFLNGSGANAQTRVPVAAAYDPVSTAIFVLVNNYSEPGASLFPPCSGVNGICHEDIVLYKILPTTGAMIGPFRFATSPSAFAQRGYAAPALACGTTSGVFNCTAVVTGAFVDRSLAAWGFSANYDTSNTATSSSGVNMNGGTTTDPPSLTFTNIGAQTFSAAVRGTNTDTVYYSPMTGYLPSGTWVNWAPVTNSVGTLTSTLAPSISGFQGEGTTLNILTSQ